MPIPHLYPHFARQGLAKSITHGYAQSVVAGSHPLSFATQNRPRFGPRRPSKVGQRQYQFQNAFHNSTQQSNVVVQEGRLEKTDVGLAAYFENLRRHEAAEAAGEQEEQEWTQFQFPKRIEWQPLDGGKNDVEAVSRPGVERSYSTSAVDDLKKVELQEDEIALATIDAALAKEIKSRNDQAIFEAELSAVAARVPTPPLARALSPVISIAESDRTPTSSFTTISTASEIRSQNYADHLSKLSENQRYAEIPAVFEAMLVADIQPTAAAYNALLDAAINLPTEKIQVVPKALDVYSDMLRRKISPNTATYNTLIDLLSSRSIEVSSLKQSLEEKRVRFGGMEVAGKFMLESSEVEFAILAEDDRLDLAMRLFNASISYLKNRSYPPETYHKLIQACSAAGRVPDMVRLFEHMESSKVTPLAATFPPLIKGFAQTGDLSSAVECYNEYKDLAVAHDNGVVDLSDRHDGQVYASVVKAYITSDRLEGAIKFYNKIMQSCESDVTIKDSIVNGGFVQGMLDRGMLPEALRWAGSLEYSTKMAAMSKIATIAADKGDKLTAVAAFTQVPTEFEGVAAPAAAMLALSVRFADVASAQQYWQILSDPTMRVSSSFIEPIAMYAVAMIGSGQVSEGLTQSEEMFARVRMSAADSNSHVNDEIEEGIEFINKFMNTRGIRDTRTPETPVFQHFTPSFAPTPVQYPVTPAYEDTYDPYASTTDFKGSSLIADELERSNNGRHKTSRLNEALGRFRNIRRAGRHPRYITYAKLITAAAREERMNLIHDILGMARTDLPLLPEYAVVRYGWTSILDAMVGACLNLGNRTLAARYHQELLDMGSSPTANTFGLYITTLKDSTKTFDEATEAVKIFHRAKSEGVEPSSFLYNALIGKLGKARRIDDCLYYFAEMRSLGIRPTSVTYGTIVNALCRVSDEKFAEELFEEMESMPNYKARPAPYNSLMQFFLTTKRDKAKVLAYYERMKSKGIEPTNHTYKLLVDTHATLEPINMTAAEAILDSIRSSGQKPEAVHYSSLIHAKGCVLHDMDGARAIFDSVMADSAIRPQACLYQSLFESMVANHRVAETEPILREMSRRSVEMTAYIANTLIHGWANEKNIDKSKSIFASVGRDKREPSTYEAMTRAYLAVEDRDSAKAIVQEMLSRGYPGAVSNKILELLGGGHAENAL
ncbi:Pentatricopeptide repeat-containing protein [Lachnellula suecica]|uniref:Pentatricopeptide repeat-containing protein n=1 Tax=Lachnellula suecica TaxID=602035 RepID=A0A8T9C042_9HELO|nr:Pentatricopeptide repeat-containing protein [Lachnellula suecica]